MDFNNLKYEQEKILDKIFDFIYGCALHDAVLQRAFKGEKAWIRGLEEPKKKLREYIEKVINKEFKNQDNHDKFFIKTANSICIEINKERPDNAQDVFSFGNAQKLINMAAKHVYSFCFYDQGLREAFRYCHCPLDSIMVNEVWDRYGKRFEKKARKERLHDRSFFCKSWGNEGQEGNTQPVFFEAPDRYKLFQDAIKELTGEELYPLEFDYLVWKEKKNAQANNCDK